MTIFYAHFWRNSIILSLSYKVCHSKCFLYLPCVTHTVSKRERWCSRRPKVWIIFLDVRSKYRENFLNSYHSSYLGTKEVWFWIRLISRSREMTPRCVPQDTYGSTVFKLPQFYQCTAETQSWPQLRFKASQNFSNKYLLHFSLKLKEREATRFFFFLLPRILLLPLSLLPPRAPPPAIVL